MVRIMAVMRTVRMVESTSTAQENRPIDERQ